MADLTESQLKRIEALALEREQASLAFAVAPHLGGPSFQMQQEAERRWRAASVEMVEILVEAGVIDIDALREAHQADKEKAA